MLLETPSIVKVRHAELPQIQFSQLWHATTDAPALNCFADTPAQKPFFGWPNPHFASFPAWQVHSGQQDEIRYTTAYVLVGRYQPCAFGIVWARAQLFERTALNVSQCKSAIDVPKLQAAKCLLACEVPVPRKYTPSGVNTRTQFELLQATRRLAAGYC